MNFKELAPGMGPAGSFKNDAIPGVQGIEAGKGICLENLLKGYIARQAIIADRQSAQRVQRSMKSLSGGAKAARFRPAGVVGRAGSRGGWHRPSPLTYCLCFILSMLPRSIWSISEPGSTCGSKASQ